MSNEFLAKLKTREPTGAAAKVAVGRKRRSIDTEPEAANSEIPADGLENLNKDNPPLLPSGQAVLEAKHGGDAPALSPSQLKNNNPESSRGTLEPETEGRTNPETDPRTQPKMEHKTDRRTQPETEGETDLKTQPGTDRRTQPETEGETNLKTQPGTNVGTESKTQPETDTGTHPKTEGETDLKTQYETDAGTHLKTEGETDLKTQPGTDTRTDPKTEGETDLKTQPGTDTRTEGETNLKTEPETDDGTYPKTKPRTDAGTYPETEGETRSDQNKEKSIGYRNRKPEDYALEMENQGSSKMRVLELLARSALAGDPYGLTERFVHEKICEKLKVTNVNLKKILVRLADEDLISCDKETSKLGRSGWVRYFVHEYALNYFLVKAEKGDSRQRSNHRLRANSSRAGATAISSADSSNQLSNQAGGNDVK